jgi:hypothetical protein
VRPGQSTILGNRYPSGRGLPITILNEISRVCFRVFAEYEEEPQDSNYDDEEDFHHEYRQILRDNVRGVVKVIAKAPGWKKLNIQFYGNDARSPKANV